MWGERDLGGARAAGARTPAHPVVDRRHRLGSALVEAARGGDAAARVPAPALAVLLDGEVRAAFVEMDPRPQPAGLGWPARGASPGRRPRVPRRDARPTSDPACRACDRGRWRSPRRRGGCTPPRTRTG